MSGASHFSLLSGDSGGVRERAKVLPRAPRENDITPNTARKEEGKSGSDIRTRWDPVAWPT